MGKKFIKMIQVKHLKITNLEETVEFAAEMLGFGITVLPAMDLEDYEREVVNGYMFILQT